MKFNLIISRRKQIEQLYIDNKKNLKLFNEKNIATIKSK